MDLVEWDLLHEADSTRYWVEESHTLGWNPMTCTLRARLLVAVYGPFSEPQAEQLRSGAADFLAFPVPAYRDLDAAEHRPRAAIMLAHLGDELLEPELGAAEPAS